MLDWLIKYAPADYRAGELGLAHPLRPELAVLALAGVALLMWWLYRREAPRLTRARRFALVAFRTIGVALLITAVLGPVLRLRQKDDASGVIAVAIDASKSMGLSAGGPSRLDAARDALSASALERLSKAGQVRLFAFGNAVRPLDAARLGALAAGDEATHLAAGIKDIAQSVRGVPLEAMLLLTDGVDTTGGDPEAMARYAAGRGTAVHAVGFGGVGSGPDAAITAVRHPRAAQAGSLVEVGVSVARRAISGPIEVKLFRGDTFIKDVELPPQGDGPQTATLSFIAGGGGDQNSAEGASSTYRIEIPAVGGEKLLDNNRRDFRIDLQESRVEVLFVEGSPRHEFAFIRRCMSDDKVFKVVTLLRLGHDRWYTSGDEGTALANGFPKTAEALGRFKAIILSDIEAAQFPADQQKLISDFVSVRGGGLLMLGGTNSFNLGGWADTPVAELLPVRLGGASAGAFDAGEFPFELTKEGTEHEILALASDPAENASQWHVMPLLKGLNPLYSAKPGAHVLAQRPASGGSPAQVLLAVQDVGAGRVAAFASANSWRWKMLKPAADDSFRRFWSQMIRWLAAGSKELLTVEPDVGVADVGQQVTITAQVLDRAHRPANSATVTAKVKDPFGHIDELTLPWVLGEEGVYRATYRPNDVGDYEIAATAELPAAGGGAGVLEPRTAAFSAVRSSPEFSHPDLDGAALTRIAEAGEGTVDLQGKLDKAIEAIVAHASNRKVAAEAIDERELRDAPLLLLAIALCWFLEWIVRRKTGLA